MTNPQTQTAEAEDETTLREAAQRLVDRLDTIHNDPTYKGVWERNQIRSGPYTGPKYDVELGALSAALAASPAPRAPAVPEELRKARAAIAEALGLFASVIKSGEAWSPTCEIVKIAAYSALDTIAAAPAAPPADGYSSLTWDRPIELPEATERGVPGQIMDAAWPEFGGNNLPADFWQAFDLAIRFTIEALAAPPADGGTGTDALVDRFADALKARLRLSKDKPGRGDAWASPEWRAVCQHELLRHIGKGDPLDVAAYTAFCWHHGWSTAADGGTEGLREALCAVRERIISPIHGGIDDTFWMSPSETVVDFIDAALARPEESTVGLPTTMRDLDAKITAQVTAHMVALKPEAQVPVILSFDEWNTISFALSSRTPAGAAFACAARRGSTGANDPQECDWPMCGCDPHADKVIASLQESGHLVTPAGAASDPVGVAEEVLRLRHTLCEVRAVLDVASDRLRSVNRKGFADYADHALSAAKAITVALSPQIATRPASPAPAASAGGDDTPLTSTDAVAHWEIEQKLAPPTSPKAALLHEWKDLLREVLRIRAADCLTRDEQEGIVKEFAALAPITSISTAVPIDGYWSNDKTYEEPPALAPAAQVNLGRDEIARIVDPQSHEDWQIWFARFKATAGYTAVEAASMADRYVPRWLKALAKADAILAARPVAEGDAGVGWPKDVSAHLGVILHVTDVPEHKREDAEFLRGVLCCARGYARAAEAALPAARPAPSPAKGGN